MKKMIAALSAVILAAVPMTGCKKERINEKPTAGSVSDDERAEESCEEAYKRMFAANFSYDGGKICYGYMLPNIVVGELQRSGRYDEVIRIFNDSQRVYVQNISHIPEITEITGKTELTDAQLEAAQKYLVARSAEGPVYVGLDAAGIKMAEGYELRSSITDQNGNPDTDVECVVYIENDGWKIIPMSAEKLEANYHSA